MTNDYHVHGVNVKVHNPPYIQGQEVIPDDAFDALYNYVCESFWIALQERTTKDYGEIEVYAEGRMGGWAVYGSGSFEPPESWVTLTKNLLDFFTNNYYPEIVKREIEDIVGENPSLERLYNG